MTKLKNIALAIATIVIFTNITQAQNLKANYSLNHEEPLTVKYLGNDGDYLTFQVTVTPDMSAKTSFEIADKNEGQLYSSNVSSYYGVKTIKIEKRDQDQVLDFKLVVGKKTYSKSFSVNTTETEKTTVAEGEITML